MNYPLRLILFVTGLLAIVSAPLVMVHALPFPPSAQLPADEEVPTWRLGDGLSVGDSYSYTVCGSVHAVQEVYPATCYELQMVFVHQMDHHLHGRIWVVDVEYAAAAAAAHTSAPDTSTDSRRTIMFLTDPSMVIHPTSVWDRPMAESIQHTILHLSPYGAQPVSMGAHWADIPTYFYDVPMSVRSVYDARAGAVSPTTPADPHATAAGRPAHTHILLGYDTVSATSRTVISLASPFPAYSQWYDPNSVTEPPRLLHEYRLTGSEEAAVWEAAARK